MPPKRAGYTVTMFVIDVSQSMSKMRNVEIPGEAGKPTRTIQMTNLEWALQFVLWKVEEMIFYNRKTDVCGVVLAGSDETRNAINDERPDEYSNVVEYIGVAHPTPDTLAKISSLQPSKETNGDALDGLIVALNAQNKYLGTKQTWTRKMIVVTDGENIIETADYKRTVEAMNANEVMTSVVGVDFDDPEFGFEEENKSDLKRTVEKFWRDKFIGKLNDGLFATMGYALQECARPDTKEIRSVLMSTVLRLGDSEANPEQSIVLNIRTSKATAKANAPPMKRFTRTTETPANDRMDWIGENGAKSVSFAPVKRRTDHFLKEEIEEEREAKMLESGAPVKEEVNEDGEEVVLSRDVSLGDQEHIRPVDSENMQLAYKYGSTYIPVERTDFQQLDTEKGLDILGFIPASKSRRDWAMGEVYYIWADTESGRMQVAFSSIVQAMVQEEVYAVIRMVTGAKFAPKVGVAVPRMMEKAECLLWVQMPFAEDNRNYTFASLDRLFNKKGAQIEKHINLPTDDMLESMDEYVDSMDLMEIEKDDEGNRFPWFDTLYSYNPTLHRVKQALFHAAIAKSFTTQPLPEPHPELTKYFTPPKKALKRAREPLEECRKRFKIKQAPPKVAANKAVTLVEDREDELLLLGPPPSLPQGIAPPAETSFSPFKEDTKGDAQNGDQTEDEDEPVPVKTNSSPQKAAVSPKYSAPSPPKSNSTTSTSAAPKEEATQIKEEEDSKPKRISSATPLEDFKAATARGGDAISDAADQMAELLKELVVAPHFPNRRKAELLECMKLLRESCLAEDEIVLWNEFLRELKDICRPAHGNGNQPFWDAVKDIGGSMSLIGKSEASKTGNRHVKYAVKDEVARQFLED